jgi:AcrR family transcriptional regulator
MTAKKQPDAALPAQQKRSEQTTNSLIDAAEEILKSEGADAATLRAIADRAGVSVGVVYRRFPDKDAILRSVYLRYFSKAAASNERVFASTDWSRYATPFLVKILIDGMVTSYRAHRHVLRALLLYARNHEDAAFRERAESMSARALDELVNVFETRRSEMNHPHPAEGIRFALTSIAAVAQDRVIFHRSTDPDLSRELVRLFSAYLGLPLS